MAKYDFDGKVAFVTGGGSGIGESIALTLASGGASVAVADRDATAAERVVAAISAAGGTAMPVSVDVSDPEAVAAAVASTVDAFGRLDIGVNNAGIGGDRAPTAEQTVESWRAVLEVNLDGVFYSMKAEIPAMLDSGGGAIVNMASILGSVGFATAGPYVAAKHGVVGLTRAAAIEYSAQGIRVNAVGPGFIRTPLLESGLSEEMAAMVEQLHPIGRMGTSQEVANLVAFLSSDEASFVTGSYYTVDGAYTAQ
jgi:NAD(P)-dependent dehydrogenase (short-subunit alcohol dehydrogenase family)